MTNKLEDDNFNKIISEIKKDFHIRNAKKLLAVDNFEKKVLKVDQNTLDKETLIARNISSGDPITAELLKEFYIESCGRKRDGKPTFLETAIHNSINSSFTDEFEIRQRKAKALETALNDLLDSKNSNSWTKPEKETIQNITSIMLVKILGEGGITEMIGEYAQSILTLDYNAKSPIFEIEGIKRNLFNHIVFMIDSISGKISESTISKKVVDSLDFSKKSMLLVTDENFKIRSLNKLGEDLLQTSIIDIKNHHLFSIIPELGSENFDFYKDSNISEEVISITFGNTLKNVHFSFSKVLAEEEITEYVFVFDLKSEVKRLDKYLFNSYSSLDNIINGLHKLRNSSENKETLGNSSDLLINLYSLKEKAKSELMKEDNDVGLEIISIDLILKQLQQEIKYLPNIDSVVLSFENNKQQPLIGYYEMVLGILRNLIVNSINFGDPEKPHTYIKASFSDTQGGTKIIVTDNGIGIERKNYEKIFLKHFKVNESSENLGLGLYYTKKNILSLNGKITIESVLLEKTTIEIILPF